MTSLLDAPCGDAGWIGKADLGVEYIGVDFVSAVVEAARAGAALRCMNTSFLLVDIIADVQPRADTILCRYCLVHPSFDNIALAIDNFRRSGATCRYPASRRTG